MGDKEKDKATDGKAAITPTIPVLRYVEEIEKKLELRKIASPAKTRPESRAFVRRSSASDKDNAHSTHNNNNNNKESVSSESDTHTHTQESAHKDKEQHKEKEKEKEKEKAPPSASHSVSHTHSVSSAEAQRVAAQVLSLLRRLTHTHDSPLSLTGTHTDADALSLAQEALQRLSAIEEKLRGSPALSLSLAEEVLQKLLALCAAANVSDAQLQAELARVRKTHTHAQGVNVAEALARESLCKTAALQAQCREQSGAASERERLALQVLRTTQRIAGEQPLLGVNVNGSNADALSLAREILLKTNALVAV